MVKFIYRIETNFSRFSSELEDSYKFYDFIHEHDAVGIGSTIHVSSDKPLTQEELGNLEILAFELLSDNSKQHQNSQ